MTAGIERDMTQKKYSSNNPDPIDIHVGSRIRMRRTLLGMSQEKLADALSITFQQVQKYENGANRVSASRLFNISRFLGVPVSFFFDGAPNNIARSGGALLAAEDRLHETGGAVLESKESIDLLRAYYAIKDNAVRRKVYEMIKSLGKEAVSAE